MKVLGIITSKDLARAEANRAESVALQCIGPIHSSNSGHRIEIAHLRGEMCVSACSRSAVSLLLATACLEMEFSVLFFFPPPDNTGLKCSHWWALNTDGPIYIRTKPRYRCPHHLSEVNTLKFSNFLGFTEIAYIRQTPSGQGSGGSFMGLQSSKYSFNIHLFNISCKVLLKYLLAIPLIHHLLLFFCWHSPFRCRTSLHLFTTVQWYYSLTSITLYKGFECETSSPVAAWLSYCKLHSPVSIPVRGSSHKLHQNTSSLPWIHADCLSNVYLTMILTL